MKTKNFTIDFDKLKDTSRVLKSVTHPTRVRLFNLLEEKGQLDVNLIYEFMEIPQNQIAHHLHDLVGTNVLLRTKVFRNSYYSLNKLFLDKIIQYSDIITKR